MHEHDPLNFSQFRNDMDDTLYYYKLFLMVFVCFFYNLASSETYMHKYYIRI
jgi:hypothetical protein